MLDDDNSFSFKLALEIKIKGLTFRENGKERKISKVISFFCPVSHNVVEVIVATEGNNRESLLFLEDQYTPTILVDKQLFTIIDCNSYNEIVPAEIGEKSLNEF